MFEWLTGTVDVPRWVFGFLVLAAPVSLTLVATAAARLLRTHRRIHREVEQFHAEWLNNPRPRRRP